MPRGRLVRPSRRAFFPAIIAVLAAWGLTETAAWPIKTALYPRVIGIPLLVLAVAETVLSLRGKEAAGGGEAMDVSFSDEVPAGVARRRTVSIVAWMVGFYLAISLIGFPRAIPLFICAYLRGQAKEAWSISLLLPAVAWLGFYLLFVRLLHLPFGEGLLWQFLIR
jgi:hypothetical protein